MPDRGPSRLTFVTGKGGVGKTTVAAGIARWASDNGEKTLAVDVAATGLLRSAVGVEGDAPTVLDLTTEASIDEYVKLYLKIPIAPSSLPILANIFDFVSTAAPAVREILTVGKIGYEAVHGDWDRIVVDGPATGHVTELLTAPEDLRRIAPAGPLATQTDWLQDALAASTTDVVVVAQAEELVVQETSELVDRLTSDTDVGIGAIALNRIPPALDASGRDEAAGLAAGQGPLRGAAAIVLADADRRQKYGAALDELSRSGGVPLLEVDDQPDDPTGAVVSCLESARWT